MAELIILALCTGAAGLGAGGLLGTLIGGTSRRFNAVLLSFTAGTMIALICFELLHEALEAGIGSIPVAFVVLFGAGLVTCLDFWVDKRSGHSQDFITCEDCDEEFEFDKDHVHCDHLEEEARHSEKEHHLKGRHHSEEVYHPEETHHLKEAHHHEKETHHHKKTSHLQLLIAGIMMAVAVAIHNVPEGMSVGALYAKAGGAVDEGLWVLLFSIVLHNVPEGMAIALPLFTSGMNRWKAAGVAALSGVPTIFGALAGYAIGDMGALGLAVSLSFAAGTLLYVVFGEVLPQSINLYCSRKTAYAAITGLAVGMLIIGLHVH